MHLQQEMTRHPNNDNYKLMSGNFHWIFQVILSLSEEYKNIFHGLFLSNQCTGLYCCSDQCYALYSFPHFNHQYYHSTGLPPRAPSSCLLEHSVDVNAVIHGVGGRGGAASSTHPGVFLIIVMLVVMEASWSASAAPDADRGGVTGGAVRAVAAILLCQRLDPHQVVHRLTARAVVPCPGFPALHRSPLRGGVLPGRQGGALGGARGVGG